MKLGIKVNADDEASARLSGANPALAEVWFNVNEKERYDALFDKLAQRGCDVGLHFWGICSGHIAPNIAHPDRRNLKESLDLMRQTIDIAAAHTFSYVNIHPGAAALSKVNYDTQRFDLASDPIDMDRAIAICVKNAVALHDYAAGKHVVLTVETVPSRITDGWYQPDARANAKNIYELPMEAIIAIARAGVAIANDFSHTAATVISDDPGAVWTFVQGATKLLAPQTRLLHIGYVIPPYNGSDVHDTLDNPIFHSAQAIPNKQQMIELLQLFAGRDDVWALAEPRKDHVKNYLLAKKLLDEAGKRN
jgi:sugar phosphate isomerase/epimerase